MVVLTNTNTNTNTHTNTHTNIILFRRDDFVFPGCLDKYKYTYKYRHILFRRVEFVFHECLGK